MINRKKKVYIIQILFLILGLVILIFTYKIKDSPNANRITSDTDQGKNLNKQNTQNESGDDDVFYNIKYSGLDLDGNRYVLTAEKATSNRSNETLINMELVEAIFYLKDGTILNINSKKGIYNNKTLDIIFTNNVEATYNENKLYSQKAEYSNLKNYVVISKDVRIESEKGNLFAEKLLFDIKKNTLNISSLIDGQINAYIDVK
jgi:LPS export ABC transporter protein LptC